MPSIAMRIGCLLDSVTDRGGGVAISVRRLSQALMARKGVIETFGVKDETEPVPITQWQPVILRTFQPDIQTWGYARRLLPALMDSNLDILLAHGLWKYSSLASHRWHHTTGKPYIIHPHGMLDPWAVQNAKWKKRLAYFAYERAHLAGASCLRALCDAEAKAIRAFGVRNPICVIPNGVDVPDPSAIYAAPWNRVGAHKVLLYLGRLHPKKNLPALLDALKVAQSLSPRARDWILVIAGWDQNDHEAKLRQQTIDLGLEESVYFIGPLFGAAKAGAYQNANAFVLPSLSEGLPMVVLEAWAYAKPVVMTPECNLPEGFAANAALATGKNADDITETLGRLSEMNDAERASMGVRGRELVSQKFLWPQIAEEMKNVCEWAVGGGAPPGCVRFN